LLYLFIPTLLEDLDDFKLVAARQVRQFGVFTYQLCFVVLRDDLISVPRWALEMRPHHFLDCVDEEAEMLQTTLYISEDLDMDERHVG